MKSEAKVLADKVKLWMFKELLIAKQDLKDAADKYNPKEATDEVENIILQKDEILCTCLGRGLKLLEDATAMQNKVIIRELVPSINKAIKSLRNSREKYTPILKINNIRRFANLTSKITAQKQQVEFLK